MAEFSDFDDEEGVDEPDLSDNDHSPAAHEEEVADNPLTSENVGDCLSLICKTGNGLSHAYVRLDISQRDITDINLLKHFIHLRYIDISGNKIKDMSALNNLTEMLTLKANKNLLKSAQLVELPYLQQMDLSSNKISSIDGINHPLLVSLNLSGNEISEIPVNSLNKLTRLTTLELRGNKLTSTKGLHVPSLKKLYIGDNMISSIKDLSRLEHLTTLYLGGNKISTLDGFEESMKALQYLNLRKNEISDLNEVGKLKCLPMLRALILQENPVAYEESYRVEVLVLLRRLERLDQDVYMDDERQEAEEIYNQRKEAEAEGNAANAVEVIHSDDEQM